MRLFHFLPWLLAGLATVAAAPRKPVPTLGPVAVGAVTVELIARETSVQPGRPFLVALKMNHAEHWHSYWRFAGTGYPTSLAWKLPPGYQAGDIQWTTPHVVRDTSGKITGNGYEGEVLHLVTITPPTDAAPGSDVTLEATAEWLMCKQVCEPGEAILQLRLPIRAEPPADDPRHAAAFARAQALLPAANDGQWPAAAWRTGNKVYLHLATNQPPATAGWHFFGADELVDYARSQNVRADARGLTIEMDASEYAPAGASRLTGVLAAPEGWGAPAGHGSIAIDAPLGAAPTAPAGPLPTATATTPQAVPTPPATGTLAGTLLLAFFGGLILNLMPCVFPVLGIKILGFVNQSGSDRKKVAVHGLSFAAGVLVSFWALAGLLLALRAGGAQLGWGFQLQSPGFVYGMAVFLLIFALNLSGLFEVGLSATGVGGDLQSKEGLAGSFFTGALATLVATPCSAPFLAPALGAALTLSAVESLLVFTAIALGLGVPYLLLSLFPRAVKLLPRPGAWMETFKQFMAFPLYATIGWLLWVLAAQTKDDDYGLLLIAFGLVLVAMAGWIYGRFGQAFGKPGRQSFGRIAAALLLATGGWLGWPKDLPAASTAAGYQVTWEKWSPEAVAAAQKAGRFVYVDFTARWCATCQTNKATVFHSDEVLTELAKKNVVLLRGDWTNRDPAITAELARWNRSAVPFNLIYAPAKPDPVVLPELLTPGLVLDALANAARRD